MILQELTGFIAGRLKLFCNLLNKLFASWMMLSIKLLSLGTILKSVACLLALHVGKTWPDPPQMPGGDHTGWELEQRKEGSGCIFRYKFSDLKIQPEPVEYI